jgi:hypothetical protein
VTEPIEVLAYRALRRHPSLWQQPLPRVLRELGIEGNGRHARMEEL